MKNHEGEIVFSKKAIEKFSTENSVNFIHSLDTEMLNQIPQELREANEEHHPIIRMCKYCGKRNGGHYIMCSAWID